MTGLLRWQIFAAYGVALASLWAYARTTKADPGNANLVLDFAPLWAILALGVYALGCVLYGVATFRDCPEAATEIEQQVAEARKELKRRGILA
jgi:dolichyl-phosphate mannosyltransferase polypeptide 3